MIDEIARSRAINRYALAESLHVPIAAVDETAITNYIGDIEQVLSGPGRRAFLVRIRSAPPRDLRFPIWQELGCDILFQLMQVWADVRYTRHRRAYRAAFPDEELGDSIISHTMNRRVAMLKGFQFVRLTPTSRVAIQAVHFRRGGGSRSTVRRINEQRTSSPTLRSSMLT